MDDEIAQRTPFVGALMLVGWQWVRDQVFDGVAAAGYDDLNPAHVGLFRYPRCTACAHRDRQSDADHEAVGARPPPRPSGGPGYLVRRRIPQQPPRAVALFDSPARAGNWNLRSGKGHVKPKTRSPNCSGRTASPNSATRQCLSRCSPLTQRPPHHQASIPSTAPVMRSWPSAWIEPAVRHVRLLKQPRGPISRPGSQRPLSGGCVGESLGLAEADVDGEVGEDIGHLAAISKLHGRAGGRAMEKAGWVRLHDSG